jgi:hypothetical protein
VPHTALRDLLDRRIADRRTERDQQIAGTGPRRVQLIGDRYHVVVPHGLDDALGWYARYLAGDPEAVDEARRIGWKSWRTHGPALVQLADQRIGTAPVACWCDPPPLARCHGDLLLAAIDRLSGAGGEP